MKYDHAQACVDLGERLTDLGNDLSSPYICDRVTIHADNAAKLKALIMEIDDLIGEIYDADKRAREEAAMEYDEYVKDNRLTTKDAL